MSDKTSRSLTSFTKDEVNSAIDKASKDQPLEGKVVLLTEDRYEEALEFIREYFLKDEPIGKAFGLQWSQEIVDIWFLPAFKLNLSPVLVNQVDNTIMAILTTTISKRGANLDLDSIKDTALREVFRIVNIANDGAKFHDRYDVDEAIHFLGLAVHRNYRVKGLATKLVNFELKMLQHLGISPLYVRVEGSSNYSKRVFENLGFETLYELVYDTYVGKFVNVGEYALRNTGEHKSTKSYGYKVC